MPESISKALADVRYAQRLLHSYYRRSLDTVQFLSEQFPDRQFHAWTNTWHDHPPQRTSSPFNRWAWDFLPINSTSFLFTSASSPSKNPTSGDWMLEVHLITDSGFAVQPNIEPDPTTFAAPEQTTSLISLVAWKCRESMPAGTTWLYDVWQKASWPDEKSQEQNMPYEALEGIQSYVVEAPMEALGSRDEITSFASKAKTEFQRVLDIPF